MTKLFTFTAKVCIFLQDGGWHYVAVPQNYTDTLKLFANRGLVAVRATVGSSSWDTSLLPMGDGSQFLPLPAKVRRKEYFVIGDMIEASFVVKGRYVAA